MVPAAGGAAAGLRCLVLCGAIVGLAGAAAAEAGPDACAGLPDVCHGAESLNLVQQRASLARKGIDTADGSEVVNLRKTLRRTPAEIAHFEKEHDCTYDDSEELHELAVTERENHNAEPIMSVVQEFGKPGPLQKVYYVNLDTSPERREYMEKQLKDSTVPVERFSAFKADEVKEGVYSYIQQGRPVCPSKANTPEWPSILANLFSHIALYEKILSEDPGGNGTYLILEDDAMVPKHWEEQLAQRLKDVPGDWTTVAAGNWGHARCSDVVYGTRTNGIALATHPMASKKVVNGEDTCVGAFAETGVEACWYGGTAAVVVSPLTVPRLLKQLKHQLPCSTDMSHLSAGDALTYSLQPPIFPGAGMEGSTIHADDVRTSLTSLKK